MLVHAFVSEPTVQALGEGILAQRDVVPLDPDRLAEAQDGMADEFGGVVADDHDRLPTTGHQRLQLSHDPHVRAIKQFRRLRSHVSRPAISRMMVCRTPRRQRCSP